MQKSVIYNNAGVACTEAGLHRVAWDLFKGALEVKLAAERTSAACPSLDPNQPPEYIPHPVNNAFIEKAESHLSKLPEYLKKQTPKSAVSTDPISSSSSSEPSLFLPTPLDQSYTTGSALDLSLTPKESLDGLYSPFCFCKPMRLSFDFDTATRRDSATIIFNLALVDHMKNRFSEQAVHLYELAMALLRGDVVDLLGIALMNNIGVWCYENGDMDGTLACMKHLATFLSSSALILDNEEEKEGLRSNILWLTNPPFAASPAA